MKQYDVYGIGNALVDIVTEVGFDFFENNGVEKGLMTLVDESRQQQLLERIGRQSEWKGGGSAANTMVAVAQLGGKSFYSCVVANDELGKYFLDDLQHNNVDTGLQYSQCEPGLTGRCLVMVSPDAERTMNTFLGVSSTLSPAVLNAEMIAASEWIYGEGYSVASPTGLETLIQGMKIAKEKGVKTALTFSDASMVKYFAPQMKEAVGQGVDLLFCNEEESFLFTGKNEWNEVIETLKKYATQFAVTRGDKGALLFDGQTTLEVNPIPTKAIDTNGAGDMFAGAFLYGLTHGGTFAEAGQLASRASSRVIQQYGPRLATSEMNELVKKWKG